MPRLEAVVGWGWRLLRGLVTASLALSKRSSQFLPQISQMVKDIRVTYRRRHSYNTESNKTRNVRTPGAFGGEKCQFPIPIHRISLAICSSPFCVQVDAKLSTT